MPYSKKQGQRAVVTGGTGFIGSNLVRHLLEEGWDVGLIVRNHKASHSLGPVLEDVTLLHHDGSTQTMISLLSTFKPTVIYHLASLFLAQHQSTDIEELIQANVMFSTQLAEAMRVNKINQLINTSSSWQHYKNYAYNPVNLYAATKQAFEDILKYYSDACGLKVVNLVLFDTYGPGDTRAKLINLLWKAAETQQPLVLSPGEQLIDLVHIDDVVRAFSMAATASSTSSGNFERYGVSSGRPMRLVDLVASFKRATKTDFPVVFGGHPYREREVMIPWSDFNVVPGWSPRVLFDDGVRHLSPSRRE